MNKLSFPAIQASFARDIQDSVAIKHQRSVIILGLFGLFVFLLMLFSYLTNRLFVAFDQPVRVAFRQWQTVSPEWLISTFKAFETAGSDGLTGMSVLLGLWWLFQRKWRPFSLMAVGIGGMELTWLAWLYGVGRPRPEEVVSKFTESSLPSFPSGHTMFFVTFFSLVFYIFVAGQRNRTLQVVMFTAVFFLMILTGIIRLFFAAHYFTDVLAGYGWGLFWAMSTILVVENFFYRRAQTNE